MKLVDAQSSFLSLIDQVDRKDLSEFLEWISGSFSTKINDVESTEGDLVIEQIVGDLKTGVPPEAILADEKIVWPATGLGSDCDPFSTCHIDSFLYPTDDDIDDLCEHRGMNRNYCGSCSSRDIKPLTFVSHSASAFELKFVFQTVLPSLKGKSVVDIGSRLGAVLYSAHLFSDAQSITGIEICPSFCQLQQAIIDKYLMNDRIKIVCNDVKNEMKIVNQADVLVMNNVFQFFVSSADQIEIWQKLRKSTRSNQVLISMPSVEQLTKHLNLSFTVGDWLTSIPVDHLVDKYKNDVEKYETLQEISMYSVK